MKITNDICLRNFDFWSGAKDTAEQLTDEDFNTLEALLEDAYPDGIDATHLNDIFWFEDDWIAEMLGYDNWEDLCRKRDPDYVDPDERKEHIRSEVIDRVQADFPDVYEGDIDDWLDEHWDEDCDDESTINDVVEFLTDLYNENEEE